MAPPILDIVYTSVMAGNFIVTPKMNSGNSFFPYCIILDLYRESI